MTKSHSYKKSLYHQPHPGETKCYIKIVGKTNNVIFLFHLQLLKEKKRQTQKLLVDKNFDDIQNLCPKFLSFFIFLYMVLFHLTFKFWP